MYSYESEGAVSDARDRLLLWSRSLRAVISICLTLSSVKWMLACERWNLCKSSEWIGYLRICMEGGGLTMLSRLYDNSKRLISWLTAGLQLCIVLTKWQLYHCNVQKTSGARNVHSIRTHHSVHKKRDTLHLPVKDPPGYTCRSYPLTSGTSAFSCVYSIGRSRSFRVSSKNPAISFCSLGEPKVSWMTARATLKSILGPSKKNMSHTLSTEFHGRDLQKVEEF